MTTLQSVGFLALGAKGVVGRWSEAVFRYTILG